MRLTTRSIKIYLKNKGIELEEADDLHINQLVHSMEQLIKIQQVIEEKGAILENESGHGTATIKNPAITAYKEYTSIVIQWCKEFGLTPKARKELTKGVETTKNTGFDLKRKVS